VHDGDEPRDGNGEKETKTGFARRVPIEPTLLPLIVAELFVTDRPTSSLPSPPR
jgi:hypothetical protein